jgi:hypothetical protein
MEGAARSRPKAVVVWPTPIAGRGVRCGEARDMSLSDRERAEGFRRLLSYGFCSHWLRASA